MTTWQLAVVIANVYAASAMREQRRALIAFGFIWIVIGFCDKAGIL